MRNVEPKWNDHGLRVDLPEYVASLKAKDPVRYAADLDFLEQKQSLHKTYPDVTFGESLRIDLGGREAQLFHARAITPGDAYLYLPAEGILVTGDVLVSPIPFAIGGSYPTEWLRTLERMATLMPRWIVPGHGEPRQGTQLLDRTRALFEETIGRVRQQRGRSMKEAQAALGDRSAELATQLGLAPEQLPDFQSYFLTTFVARAFHELSAPLGDLPDGMPGP
jgi:glyoxylase-like metal-dependent hydrolase (beta-lactamase superfamily II)